MSVYKRRMFTALKSKAVRIREDTYVIDAGAGRPRIALANELIDPPESAAFSTKVGFLHAVKGESTVKNSLLQRCFVDLVTEAERRGEVRRHGRADGLLPRRFRKQRAWLELQNEWKSNRKVKGFVAGKVRGGYSVGVGGYLAFLPARNVINRRIGGDRYAIESLSPGNFVVTKVD